MSDSTPTSTSSTSSLAPVLLLSMPQLADPNFHRSVVLLCEHGAEGAFGLVLNRPTETPASEVIRLDPPVAAEGALRLWIGGPVEPQRGWILLDEKPAESDAVCVCDGVYLSASADLVRKVPGGVAHLRRQVAHRLRRMGAGSAGRRTVGVRLADGRRRSRHRVSNLGGPHVGGGDSPPGRGSGVSPDEPRRALVRLSEPPGVIAARPCLGFAPRTAPRPGVRVTGQRLLVAGGVEESLRQRPRRSGRSAIT